jgi:hypothetical protein
LQKVEQQLTRQCFDSRKSRFSNLRKLFFCKTEN